MGYDPEIHHRRSIRLEGRDYSRAGVYFVTICTQGHLSLFGKIENGEMNINQAGVMVQRQWNDLLVRFDTIKLHEFIVMPNHFHGIIEIVGVPLVGTQKSMRGPHTVGDVVGAFKSLSTNEYILGVKNNNWPRFNKYLWQQNYFEHIIRNEKSYLKISEYIRTNPSRWSEDKYYQ
ncbi:MAG: transposase [Phycisphaerae bacterium]|nr:transposase [Phycisphaerae bacterium]